MSIKVTKVSQAYYGVVAMPPDVYEPWSSTELLRLNDLCAELTARGAHQREVGDAIDQADRDWLDRAR